MAIGAIFNSLIYGGVDSADYGVYVTGDAVFNAPKRAVELVSVPGRNGAIEIDQGHFENIEVSYPAGMFGNDQTDFRERLSDFRNAIMSQKGYQRLSDTYHPDEFRMGIYVDGLEVEPKHYNEAGQFTLRFNCKPQRFLTSGEEVITIGEWEDYETVTGDKVTFEADDTTKIKDIKTDINPKQAGDAWSSTPEQAPYLLRRSPQLGHDYFKEFDTLIGGTIAWNQLADNTIGGNRSTVATTGNSHTITAAGTGTSFGFIPRPNNNPFIFTIGHKYAYSINLTSISVANAINFQIYDTVGHNMGLSVGKKEGVIQATATAASVNVVTSGTPSTSDTFTVKDVMFIDLTATFGTEIADYVYTLEQATSGSGIAWLKAYGFLTKDYYAYDDGSLVSVKTSEHRTTGKNLLDIDDVEIGTAWNGASASNRARLVVELHTGATYTLRMNGTSNLDTAYYNLSDVVPASSAGTGNPLTASTFVATNKYLIIGFNKTDIAKADVEALKLQLELGTTATAYEPYESHSYPLDSDLELRGIPKLSSGSLYYDGDEYRSDGTVTRKYGIVDLGTLTYTRITSYSNAYFKTTISGKKVSTPLICSKYALYLANGYGSYIGNNMPNNMIAGYGSTAEIAIRDDSYIDAAAFKTAMSGVYLVYELETPTTETADSFTSMQAVSPDGTEEYVDTRSVPVPVGHRTTYSAVYPIRPYFDIDIYHSPTPDSADATEYEIGTGTAGRVFGGVLDVTAGKLLVTDKNINYYDGETLPSTWISDRDQYAPGTTPSIGAQVVYKLASPEEYDVTPTQIDALIGSNYIWSNSGDVTVEYGWNPNIITNPTLFDARPLLMVEGYGNIEMNGKDIELKRVVIGNVSIAGAETKQFGTSITMEIGFNPEQFNTGDVISVNPFVFASDYYYELHGDELTLYTATDQLQGAQTTFQKEGASYYKIQTAWPALTFYVGTDAEYTNEAIITGEAGGQGFLNQRLHTKVELSHRSSTYAVIKFTFNSGSMYENLYVIATERKLILNGINGDSTLLTLGHPTYIDCDLGEAYMIKNGTAISLNAYIDLGSDLPSLGPGLNRIDFDDTITELKLRPDWWKV